MNLHLLLDDSAGSAPERAAYVRDGLATSYGELARATARFAAALHELGVSSGDRVALVLDGSIDYLIAYYGTLRAGAVAVPLCSDTRAAPLRRALSDSQACAVVLEGTELRHLDGQRDNLPDLRLVIARGKPHSRSEDDLEVVDFAALLAHATLRDGSDVSGSALASIIYTSGTSGEPKGVMLSHDNLLANSASIVEYLELSRDDVVGMVLPYYYSYGNSVLHTHLRVGATIAQLTGLAFPSRTLEELARLRCTGLSGVPATLARLVDASAAAERDLSALRYITQAGAAMPAALLQRVRAAFPHTKVFVMYGQTEASARLACVPPAELDAKPGSVGRAIPGVSLAVHDAEGRALAPGHTGEVVARGDNIMLGYWRKPAESAEALRDGWLHTGDLGHLDDDGYLFLSGRKSELIKSAAHRIGPREIEEVIESIPGVRACAVFGIPDELLGQAVAAFVVPVAALGKAAFMRACMEQLPRFKVPQHVRVLDELPCGATGKLQRAQLAHQFEQGLGRPLV